jgi:PKD domain-containing protein
MRRITVVVLVAACAQEAGVSEQDQAVTATTQIAEVVTPLASESIDLGGYRLTGRDPITSTTVEIDIATHARWIAGLRTGLSWDSDDVRQGAGIDMARTSVVDGGQLRVLWTVTGTFHPFGLSSAVTIGPLAIGLDAIACTPNITPLVKEQYNVDPGTGVGDYGKILLEQIQAESEKDDDSDPKQPDSVNYEQQIVVAQQLAHAMMQQSLTAIAPQLPSYTCQARARQTLVETPGIPLSPYIKLTLLARFNIVQQKAAATSQFLIDGDQAAQSSLDITPAPATESLAMPCNKPSGSDVQYDLNNFSWQPESFLMTQQPFLTIGTMDPVAGVGELPPAIVVPLGNPVKHTVAMQLTGPGATTDLGPLQANNVLPTVTAGPFAGVEGVPVQLSQTSLSACPITSYAWTFSNGTSSFGPSPLRAFGPHGAFDGQLVVTDSTHLSATTDFAISIANAPPVPNAGPATSGAWGTPIALVGQASDPGGGALTTSWNFGDGTPGVGGATATHAYALPGDYVATFTACDDAVCVPATTSVHVRARTTSVAFTGTNTGTYSATAGLSGAIVDELGQPVVGGTLAFTLAGSAAGSAQTDASGTATSTQTIDLAAGSYPITASFAGTARYVGGSATGTFSVSRMPSSVTYSGATSGGPNKTVALTAKLVDAQNRPLAGKSILFQLGVQSASAVTGATGIATTSLKLTQKNGSYALTTTWTPTAVDGTQWTGASATQTFVIGK